MFYYDENKNTIETERFILRRFVLEDAARGVASCNTEEVYKGVVWAWELT